MPFLALPNETILEIATHLGASASLNALLLSCRRLAHLLTPTLYSLSLRHDAGYLPRYCITHSNAPLLRLLSTRYHANLNSGSPAPLSFSIASSNTTMTSLLLSLGADPSAGAALHTAARYGDTAALQTLLKAGAHPDTREEARGETALHWAVRWGGGKEVVGVLLEAGADVDAVSGVGETPAEVAARGLAGLRRTAREMGGRGAFAVQIRALEEVLAMLGVGVAGR